MGDMQLAHRQTERFRKNLGTVCREHGAIQKIADDAGMTRAYVSNIIHGKVSPSLENSAKIADAIGLTLTDLLADPKEFSFQLQKTA